MAVDHDSSAGLGTTHLGTSASTPIDSSNIGFQLLKKQGWKEGTGLGVSQQGDLTAIEEAALARNREAVKILFPLSKPIESYPEWSVNGIMEYCHSEKAKTEATHYDPTNPTWTSKQSLCNVHANRCVLALYDVERFLRVKLHMPGPHPGDADAAACISKNFVIATYALMLFPQDATLSGVFRLCVFDYFVWLYMLSSPEEITDRIPSSFLISCWVGVIVLFHGPHLNGIALLIHCLSLSLLLFRHSSGANARVACPLTSEPGVSIIDAGASGDLKQLKAIRNKVDDIRESRKICDEYSDFTTGWNVLHYVVEIGNFEICKFLIRTVKVYIDALNYNDSGDTPLAKAVKGEHVKIVEFLVKHGAEISLPNIEGFTPLHYAVLKDNMELMELLLRKDALVDVDSVDGTPLQIAVSCGNVQAVKYILSRGAWPSLFCAFADTPLVCAVKSHSFECLELLLEAGADPNLFFSGISPLGVAAKEGDTKFLKRLLKAKADPDADLFKPIEDAAMVRNREAVEILFPVTKRLTVYPNWTVDDIIEYIHSGEFKTLREQKLINRLAELDFGGMRDVSNKQYTNAVLQYRMASLLEPSNPTWISKRSLWEARGLNNTGTCMTALFDAQECIRLKPDFPVPRPHPHPHPHPHHGSDIAAAANELFKKYLMAGLVFALDPYNEEILRAFRLTLFNYFAWLSQVSSADVILSFSL
ncbi:uncharacterized protein LOC121766703 [Salvia splendens]|uniref:uncharacterized protein LOC121766703 n=1 Tax=Salvia splendens TaxID=180675 RepID=UPI001C268BC1|nr:uncharacterized protein LOC121766703 [Salvia splendens]